MPPKSFEERIKDIEKSLSGKNDPTFDQPYMTPVRELRQALRGILYEMKELRDLMFSDSNSHE